MTESPILEDVKNQVQELLPVIRAVDWKDWELIIEIPAEEYDTLVQDGVAQPAVLNPLDNSIFFSLVPSQNYAISFVLVRTYTPDYYHSTGPIVLN